jgi:hypothetical protein
MMIVPAGNRIVDGLLRNVVVPLFHGVVPAAQVMLVLLEFNPRASTTALDDG